MDAPDQFVAEPIKPDPSTFDPTRMAAGEPGLPGAFDWRGRTIRIAGLLRTWRGTGPCRHGSGDRYVRRHWYEVATVDGEVMTIYCDRTARRGDARRRWWLYGVGRSKRE